MVIKQFIEILCTCMTNSKSVHIYPARCEFVCNNQKLFENLKKHYYVTLIKCFDCINCVTIYYEVISNKNDSLYVIYCKITYIIYATPCNNYNFKTLQMRSSNKSPYFYQILRLYQTLPLTFQTTMTGQNHLHSSV